MSHRRESRRRRGTTHGANAEDDLLSSIWTDLHGEHLRTRQRRLDELRSEWSIHESETRPEDDPEDSAGELPPMIYRSVPSGREEVLVINPGIVSTVEGKHYEKHTWWTMQAPVVDLLEAIRATQNDECPITRDDRGHSVPFSTQIDGPNSCKSGPVLPVSRYPTRGWIHAPLNLERESGPAGGGAGGGEGGAEGSGALQCAGGPVEPPYLNSKGELMSYPLYAHGYQPKYVQRIIADMEATDRPIPTDREVTYRDMRTYWVPWVLRLNARSLPIMQLAPFPIHKGLMNIPHFYENISRTRMPDMTKPGLDVIRLSYRLEGESADTPPRLINTMYRTDFPMRGTLIPQEGLLQGVSLALCGCNSLLKQVRTRTGIQKVGQICAWAVPQLMDSCIGLLLKQSGAYSQADDRLLLMRHIRWIWNNLGDYLLEGGQSLGIGYREGLGLELSAFLQEPISEKGCNAVKNASHVIMLSRMAGVPFDVVRPQFMVRACYELLDSYQQCTRTEIEAVRHALSNNRPRILHWCGMLALIQGQTPEEMCDLMGLIREDPVMGIIRMGLVPAGLDTREVQEQLAHYLERLPTIMGISKRMSGGGEGEGDTAVGGDAEGDGSGEGSSTSEVFAHSSKTFKAGSLWDFTQRLLGFKGGKPTGATQVRDPQAEQRALIEAHQGLPVLMPGCLLPGHQHSRSRSKSRAVKHECAFCSKVYPTRSKLFRHLEACQMTRAPPGRSHLECYRTNRCVVCDQQFSSRLELRRHLHTNPVSNPCYRGVAHGLMGPHRARIEARAPASLGSGIGEESEEVDVARVVDSEIREALTMRADPDRFVECPICLCDFSNPVVTHCGHKFCAECLQNWQNSQHGNTCPICRNEIEQTYRVAW